MPEENNQSRHPNHEGGASPTGQAKEESKPVSPPAESGQANQPAGANTPAPTATPPISPDPAQPVQPAQPGQSVPSATGQAKPISPAPASANQTGAPAAQPASLIDQAKKIPGAEVAKEAPKVKEEPVALEVVESALKLKEQYESQKKVLSNAGVAKKQPYTKRLGITGIDGKEYPLPSYESILKRLEQKKDLVNKKVRQGFTRLLLVPLGMSLESLVGIYKQVILKHYEAGRLLAAKKGPEDLDDELQLNQEEIVWVWKKYQEADIQGKIVYYPKNFLIEHEGKTKQELLEKDKHAWNILLVEDSINIPREGQGRKIADRPQIETGRAPEDYIGLLQTADAYKEEQGLTPEDQLIYAISTLEQTDQMIDDYQGNGSICYQIGAYFPAFKKLSFLPVSDYVPGSGWGRDKNQASLDGFNINYRRGDCGTRTAVAI